MIIIEAGRRVVWKDPPKDTGDGYMMMPGDIYIVSQTVQLPTMNCNNVLPVVGKRRIYRFYARRFLLFPE